MARWKVHFPIPGVPKDFCLKGAVFADAGTLLGRRLDPLKLAALDYAYALTKDEGVQTSVGRVGEDQIRAFRCSGRSKY
ncbi:hypothetical protein GCM10007887_36870 [Methylobacterium haplocladii]|uniref:Uncharacterized protein n=1 Tax=Methylobacterium haplocladii TaxID=1176176 RepID=A0A512IPY5_9HYPH|nr:hypothetical protein [Methylobacterium haplocladii]GEO99771.1 hypothetical protein MHA02_21590 [Methylobacterium haplocladii]GJD84597.1 hypothetical protein HPGCJGGD_2476 [Methylobacterium haplocladii]GLS60995.1 hypothetical protein GCM10007887_36870 [Methylobacterium haplocladii]